MKRLILTLAMILILILAACNSPQESSPTNNEEAEQEKDMEDLDKEDESEDMKEEEQEQDQDQEHAKEEDNEDKEEPEQAEESDSQDELNENKEEKQDTTIELSEKKEGVKHEKIVDLAYEVFDAQFNKDYEFLESVISEGTKLDKKNNTFKFENVTYPHEQPLLTEKDVGELEFRFTHEESEDSIIIGFGAINYETESSFTIDVEFIKEDGNWKMNDMDINK